MFNSFSSVGTKIIRDASRKNWNQLAVETEKKPAAMDHCRDESSVYLR